MAHDHRNEADDSEFNQFYCSPSGNSKSSCIQHLFFLVFHSVNNKPINIANYCFFQIKGYVYRTINSLSALMKGPRRRDHISAFLKSTRKNARTTWISKSQFSFLLLPIFFIAINLLFYLLPLFFTYTHKHTHIQVQDGIISTSPLCIWQTFHLSWWLPHLEIISAGIYASRRWRNVWSNSVCAWKHLVSPQRRGTRRRWWNPVASSGSFGKIHPCSITSRR